MKKNNKIISVRDILIVICIAIAILVVGSIKDIDVTTRLYNPEQVPGFAVFLFVIGKYPASLGMTYIGTLLILMSKQLDKFKKVLSIICAIALISYGTYLSFEETFNIANYKNIGDNKYLTLIQILFIVLGVLVTTMVFLLTWRIGKNKSIRELFTVVMYIGAVIFMGLIVTTGAKYLVSRPRPYRLYNNGEFPAGFKNWWEISPFMALKEHGLTSFPSGHCGLAMTGIFILPTITLLLDNQKNNRRLQIVLFYAGVIFALIEGYSRLYAGDHFLSDIGAGFLCTAICGWIVNIFYNKRENDLTSEPEHIEVNE